MNGLEHYARLFGDRARVPTPNARRTLDRGSLPTPLRYLTEQGLLTGRPRGEWVQIRCPSHKGGGERRPSMGVSLVDGHFACHACGARGGDVVGLHMLVTGRRFPDAVADLGGCFHD